MILVLVFLVYSAFLRYRKRRGLTNCPEYPLRYNHRITRA